MLIIGSIILGVLVDGIFVFHFFEKMKEKNGVIILCMICKLISILGSIYIYYEIYFVEDINKDSIVNYNKYYNSLLSKIEEYKKGFMNKINWYKFKCLFIIK